MSFLFEKVMRRVRDRLWIGPAFAGLLAVLYAALALWIGKAFESDVGLDISEDSLVTLLGIIASSMLTVATFAIAAILASASAVTSTTTPRASRLVINDSRGKFVLSAFVAAFIYSIVAIIALKAFTYGSFGRFVLFSGLIVIIVVVLVAFVGWTDYVLKLGRQYTTIDRLLQAALDSLTTETVGTFGARPWDGTIPAGSHAVHPSRVGYVLSIGGTALQQLAEEEGLTLTVTVRPGELADPTTPVAYARRRDGVPLDARRRELIDQRVLGCVDIDDQRHPDLDVRFNVINLAETADRALSPGVNDPGTAINVLLVQLCVFGRWAELRRDPASTEVVHPDLAVPPLTAAELVSDAFTPVARDGASVVEVGIRLHKTLAALDRLDIPELSDAVRTMARTALEQSDEALVAAAHRHRLHELAVVS